MSTNTTQLIDIIFSELSENKIFHHGYTQNNKLIVTGSNNTPVQISHGVVIYREDISPNHGRSVIGICITVKNEEQTAHGLLACDTVACYFGIGKVKALKTLRAGFSLSCLGDIHASLPDVTKQETECVGACYGHKHHTSMSEARKKMSLAAKVGKGSTSTPHLNNLPPTTEAFVENVKRAHIQACVWKRVTFSTTTD